MTAINNPTTARTITDTELEAPQVFHMNFEHTYTCFYSCLPDCNTPTPVARLKVPLWDVEFTGRGSTSRERYENALRQARVYSRLIADVIPTDPYKRGALLMLAAAIAAQAVDGRGLEALWRSGAAIQVRIGGVWRTPTHVNHSATKDHTLVAWGDPVGCLARGEGVRSERFARFEVRFQASGDAGLEA